MAKARGLVRAGSKTLLNVYCSSSRRALQAGLRGVSGAAAAEYWDHNWCWVPNASAYDWMQTTMGVQSLTAWRLSSGFDSHSAITNPKLDATSFAPESSSSPVVDAADADHAPPLDMLGQTRQGEPDVGALEYR